MMQKLTSWTALVVSVVALLYAFATHRRVETVLRNSAPHAALGADKSETTNETQGRDREADEPLRTENAESKSDTREKLNTSPATYIGNVYADKAGLDGLKIRIRLRDQNDQETASDGKLTILVADQQSNLLRKEYPVRSTDFKVEKYGIHDRLMFSPPRILFSELSRPPRTRNGKVTVVFETPDGQSLTGAADLYTLIGQ